MSMYNTKLLVLLKRFDKEEVKSFGKYLKNRYANEKTLIKIYDELKRFHPQFDSNKLTKEYIFSKVIGEPYTEKSGKRTLNLFHNLLKIAEEFLILEQLKNKDMSFYRDRLLLEVYKSKDLDTPFKKLIDSALDDLNSKPLSIWRYAREMELNHIRYYYYDPEEKIEKQIKYLQEANRNLQLFTRITTNKYKAEFFNRSKIIKDKDEEKEVMEKLHLDQNEGLSTLDKLYRLIPIFIEVPNVANYFELKDLFIEHCNGLEIEEKFTILAYLINYTSFAVKKLDESWLRESFDLYRFGFNENIIPYQNTISELNFLNIINIACELKEYDWAKKFIQESSKFLVDTWKEIAITRGLARIAFGEGEFGKAISLLNSLQFKDESYSFVTMVLLTKCYYEVKEENTEFLKSFINAFKTRLRRNKKLTVINTRALENFLEIVRYLIQDSKNITMEELLVLLHSKKDLLVSRSWLEEKIKNRS